MKNFFLDLSIFQDSIILDMRSWVLFAYFLAESRNGRKGYLGPTLFEVKYWVWKMEEFEEKIAKIFNDVNCSPFYPVPYFSDSNRMFVILVYMDSIDYLLYRHQTLNVVLTGV
jgi:hypothetical protein